MDKADMDRKKPVITVVGSFAVGLTMRVPRFPVAGETLMGTDFDMGPGGKGSNQAVCAARLGAESHLVARVGKDSFAQIALDLYRREGVDTRHVLQQAGRNTGVGFIVLNEAGQNQIVIDPGANDLLSAADVDEAGDILRRSRVVLSVMEIKAETAGYAMAAGKKHGAVAILNPAPAVPLGAEVLSYVDVLTPNESELRILSGLDPDDPTDTLELARGLQQKGVRTVVVTRGEDGALIVNESGDTENIPGYPVEVVDTTGAGDAFNAALAVFLAEGRSLGEAVRIATFAGALTCTKLGVIPGLPFRDDIERILEAEGMSGS
jgi:ribokinase